MIELLERGVIVYGRAKYERVIRQNRKPTAVTEAAARCPVAKTPNYEHFLEYQRKRDCSEKEELGEEDWAVLQESVNKQLAEYEDLMQKIKKQSCEVDKAFDTAKGASPEDATSFMTVVRRGKIKGRDFTEAELTLLKRCEAEEWFISVCRKVEYLFPESHSIAYAILMIRLVWYVLHYPDVTDSLMIETAMELLQE